MARPLRLLSLSILCTALMLTAGPTPGCAEDEEEHPQALPHRALDIGATQPVEAAAVRAIQARIERLVALKNDHGGLTSTSGGGPYFETDGRWMTAEEPDDADRAFGELIAAGPVAVPFLLAHLDDVRQTAMVQKGFGQMWLAMEIDVNPADRHEITTMRAALSPPEGAGASGSAPSSRDIDGHVVTVGDVCFAALGQIINRAYQAVRYQPTGCNVVNSPTADPRLARAVRAPWRGREPRAELARRLMVDLHTPGDDRRRGGALRRLVRYYPEASVPWLVGALERAVTAGDADRGPPVKALAAAAAVLRRPEVLAGLRPILLKTNDPAVFLTALNAWPDDRTVALFEHARRHMLSLAKAGDDFRAMAMLLQTVKARWPTREREIVTALVADHGLQVVRWVLATYHDKRAPTPAAVWRSWLDVRKPATEWTSNPPDPLERLRVCDAAALQVAAARKDLTFDASADERARDRQLTRMRTALDAAAPNRGGK